MRDIKVFLVNSRCDGNSPHNAPQSLSQCQQDGLRPLKQGRDSWMQKRLLCSDLPNGENNVGLSFPRGNCLANPPSLRLNKLKRNKMRFLWLCKEPCILVCSTCVMLGSNAVFVHFRNSVKTDSNEVFGTWAIWLDIERLAQGTDGKLVQRGSSSCCLGRNLGSLQRSCYPRKQKSCPCA